MSTYTNIREVMDLIKEAKQKRAEETAAKIKGRFRTKFVIAFIDFAKAFDSVPRQELIREFRRIGISNRLSNIYLDLMNKTTFKYSRELIPTEVGCP